MKSRMHAEKCAFVTRLLLVALCALPLSRERAAASEFAEPFDFAPADSPFGGTRSPVRGAWRLATRAPDGKPLHGLSGLAWLDSKRLLVAVSDHGELIHLRPTIQGGVLTAVTFAARHPLRNARGAPLIGAARDAEGLALEPARAAAHHLLVSFEHDHRVVRYTLDGYFRGELPLPGAIARRLARTTPNHGLEALAFRHGDGPIAGLEYPGESASPRIHLHGFESGRTWAFPPSAPGSALVGLDVTPGGDLLTLERRYISPLHPLLIVIGRLAIAERVGPFREIVRFSSAHGWPVDNFEGIAAHDDSHCFVLSDDNASTAQKSLLVYLALPDD